MNITPEIIDDAVAASNFTQWFKMTVWEQMKIRGKRELVEQDLDEIASKVWEKLR